MKKGKTIVVTGAAGFIGFHTARALLERGDRVIGIDNMNDYYDPKIKAKRRSFLKKYSNFTFYKVDIVNYPKIEKILTTEKPDEIIHLAAQAGVRYSHTNPWAYMDANSMGTLNIFEGAKRSKIKRVIYASSSSVYGSNIKSPMHEDDRVDSQISIYAATKKANETLAHVYNHLNGMEMVGLRFFTVYGEWGRPDLALFKFVKNIAAGKSIDVYNHGKMKRSFTHISDIVAGILAIVDTKIVGKNDVYNLGGAEPTELLTFIYLIETELGKKAKKNFLGMQAGDVPETVADWSRAHKDLGFIPKTKIADGVAEFVRWFTANEKFLSALKEPKQ